MSPIMSQRKAYLLLATLFVSSLNSTPLQAQMTLAEAEKVSAQTGRTMFVVAGRKT